MRVGNYLTAFTIILVIVSLQLKDCNSPVVITGNTITKHDTVYKIIPETTYVYRKGATVHVTDTFTIIQASPFVATSDTTIDKVHISDTFYFPQMLFGTRIHRSADSIEIIEKTYYRSDTVMQSSSSWQSTAGNVLSLIVGFFLGKNAR